MKTYTIGRDNSCDIVIADNTDVISRRHALLTVTPSGKMTITDHSSNGTYVNGIRISPNVPVPVTRKDNISLARVSRLDWARVPKQNGWIKYLIIAVAIIAVAACAFIFTNKPTPTPIDPVNPDTVKVENDTLPANHRAKKDSLKNKPIQPDTAKVKNKPAKTKNKPAKDKDDATDNETNTGQEGSKQEDTQSDPKRIIG